MTTFAGLDTVQRFVSLVANSLLYYLAIVAWFQVQLRMSLERTAAVTWCRQLWEDPGAAFPSSCLPAHATCSGARLSMRPLLGSRICIFQASVLPLVTHLLSPVLQWGQTRTCYRAYWNEVNKFSSKKSIQNPHLTVWADFINLSLLFFPMLAYFPMCSGLGSGMRFRQCSSCHGEKLEIALYLFNLFLNGSVLQNVKSAWLAHTPDTMNHEYVVVFKRSLCFEKHSKTLSFICSWFHFFFGIGFPWRLMSEMSTEAELTLTSIKSQFFYPIQRHLMSVLLKYAISMRLLGVSGAQAFHSCFIYLYSN